MCMMCMQGTTCLYVLSGVITCKLGGGEEGIMHGL